MAIPPNPVLIERQTPNAVSFIRYSKSGDFYQVTITPDPDLDFGNDSMLGFTERIIKKNGAESYMKAEPIETGVIIAQTGNYPSRLMQWLIGHTGGMPPHAYKASPVVLEIVNALAKLKRKEKEDPVPDMSADNLPVPQKVQIKGLA